MKRFKHGWMLWLSILAALCLLMSPVHAEDVLKAQASSEQYTSGDYTYSYVSSSLYPDFAGTISIDKYSGNASHVTVPSTLAGLTVTFIGPESFTSSSIQEVTIPKTVQKAPINWIYGVITSAFSECPNLKTISFEEGTTKVCPQICWNSTSLETAHIPDGVTEIGENAFRGCTNLTAAYIPASVETIPYNAFYGCSNLVIYGEAGSYAETYAEKYGFAFTVYPPVPEEIKLNTSSLSLQKGSSKTLTCTVSPADASQNVTWSSSDSSIAAVSNGKVTGISVGTATINVETVNGLKASCKVTVTPPDAASVSLNQTSLSLEKGKNTTVTASVSPSDASQDVTWTSSNTDVATVSDGKITAVSAGTATITAKTANGKTASCTVTVPAPPATSVSLNLTSITLEAGQTSTLVAKVNPSDASQSVSWSSSDLKVAHVSNGTVKGISIGTATITAKTSNGITVTCLVTVKEAESIPIYRLYMPSTGEHLYTSDKHEYDTLYKKYGWGQEGIGWYAPSSGTAVYRLYQPGLKNHLYTTDKNEVKVLTSKYGWVTDNGGEALYHSGGSVPIYRVYNKGLNGMHHLTTDTNEYNTLPKFGWQQEGATLYATKLGSPYATTKFYK